MADWKSTLGAIAPTIATALGGPVAGLAVNQLGSFFGLWGDTEQPPANAEELVAGRVQAMTSEEAIKLKVADNDFKARMRELGIKEKELVIQDVQDARKTFKEDSAVKGIGIITIVGFFGVCGWLVIMGLPESAKDNAAAISIISLIVGHLSAKAGTVYDYLFGSSSSTHAEESKRIEDATRRLK